MEKTSSLLIIAASMLYLILLFLVGWIAERYAAKGKSIASNPYVYALSLAVFCTAWTFYGSVGKASHGGIDYLAVYIGPTLAVPLWFLVLRKMIRICKVQRITTIADFISSRYGKNISLAILVTVFLFIGIIPYISIQLKAIAESFEIMISSGKTSIHANTNAITHNTAFIVAMCMSIFTILFGTRRIEANERHEGMVAAIAFESIVKLVAFISIGVYVTYFCFNGFQDIFSKVAASPQGLTAMTIPNQKAMSDWFWITVLSGIAATFLPRQFQVTVVENLNEQNLKKAIWLFPLYLLLINIFVWPIAFGGNLLFNQNDVDPDFFVLNIPLIKHQYALSLFVFIGGFAAATGMIIVETIALSTMFSNHIVIPIILGIEPLKARLAPHMSLTVIRSRRVGMLLIIGSAYLYYRFIGNMYSLVSVGLISFVSIAQLAPSIIGGLFWKRANKKGALAGLIAGAFIWFYTLILPSIIQFEYWHNPSFSWLNPTALFGLHVYSPIVHGMFWSLGLNILLYIGVSVYTQASVNEENQAEIFVNILNYSKVANDASTWSHSANLNDIESLLAVFLGEERSKSALHTFAQRNHIDLKQRHADPKLIAYAERVLSGIIGSASARIMVSSAVKEEEIRVDALIDILRESQQLLRLNRELKRKTDELELTRIDLESLNQKLVETDELKNDFLATVTHELRTPITSIRAFSEILLDNDDIPEEERRKYLLVVQKETERLSRLISQVLDLERYESGKQLIQPEQHDMRMLIQDSVDSVEQLLKEKNLQCSLQLPDHAVLAYFDYDKIQQVVVNLLSNAIKFAQHHISVNLEPAEDGFYCRVQDDGKGVDPEFAELIFEKFFQARNQTIRKPKGSGLGLAICRVIIELHQGEIGLAPSDANGATFYFRLKSNYSV